MKAATTAKKRPGAPIRHREVPATWAHRNDGAHVIDIPGPVFEVPMAPPGGLVPYYGPPAPAAKPRPARPGAAARAGQAARAAVAKVAPTLAPAPFSLPRLGEAAALAGGLLVPTLAAGELGLHESKPVAIGELLLGTVGFAVLDDHWRKLAFGLGAAGAMQLTHLMQSERLRAKAAKEAQRKRELEQAIVAMAVQQAHAVATQTAQSVAATAVPALPAPPAAAPARNAPGGWDLTPAYAAVDQAHAELAAADARNAWGWDGATAAGPEVAADPRHAWAWMPADGYAAAA